MSNDYALLNHWTVLVWQDASPVDRAEQLIPNSDELVKVFSTVNLVHEK